MTDRAEQLVGEEEGRSRTVYPDTRKIWTIAIGCVVDPKVPGAGLCDEAIEAQFAHDSLSARSIASLWPNYSAMNDVRKAVLVSMAFQLGNKPRGWPQFMAALTVQNFEAAADAGLDSDWARDETPKRANREMAMLRSGQWVERT